MRKILLSTILMFLCLVVQAQSGRKLLFESSKFVWCGLDYSNVKCIGSEGFNEPYEIKYKYFNAWNHLVLNEADKYDLQKAYYKEGQVTDLSVVDRRNDIPEVDELVINDSYMFEKGKIQEIINDYDLEKADQGLGLVYVVESLNKYRQSAVIYVVFFDIASKEILWARSYTTEARGFGFRNYWARTIYNTIKASGDDFKIEKKRYKKGK
ncbi:hypothetical protein JMN32_09465 [Fulvivirga sp. 29W222]|uniref:Uncharacterized protein n=1 Tax=Fulvivirga marina TaxID=2494733 RepID=A0A937KBQ1_9BACT|nr:hypothetical protein [Fulvivirga marina]MBL6446537.1 hypothetical protein [Fulvivirga marina]